jgi:predicted  nucleic acid-binding Zn-ribbon protein
MWLFKSKEEKAEEEFIGEKVSCARCGKKYYEAKKSQIPMELIEKYEPESVVKCIRCGRVYCSRSMSELSCRARGCLCGSSHFQMGRYVKRRNNDDLLF